MVGLHFCKSLVKRGLVGEYEVQVIGAETVPAYDRIHLSSYVTERKDAGLILEPTSWYEENGISLILGERVTSVDSESQKVTLGSGDEYTYDYLVFATGSRAFAPSIDGIEQENVVLYRTIEDIKKIVALSEGKKHATVIGGGLLGLEAAQAFEHLGLEASVVHIAGHLMSAQLTPSAAAVLQEKVEQSGIDVLLKANTKAITTKEERLELAFADGRSLETDLVVVSAGIRPNSELASDAGIACGIRGGIIVNHHLETSEANIFAIGECALLEGQIFGLAAPGYAMAEHLATRLAGEKVKPMDTPDMSTKLKMVGVDVTCIGDALTDGVQEEFVAEGVYRSMTLSPKGELLGAMGVGEWEESARIQELFREGAIIRPKEREYFKAEGVLSEGGGENSVQQWPDNRVICNCMGITKGEIIGCFKTCGQDPDKIAASTSCSEVCGSCRPLLEELCNKPPSLIARPVAVKRLMTLSILAVLGILAVLIFPPAPIADSVESWYYQIDRLWRNNVTKQITGYIVMGIFVLGMLISLRKRFKWFRFGHFNRWRVFHALFGVSSVVALYFHTGFHFGLSLIHI